MRLSSLARLSWTKLQWDVTPCRFIESDTMVKTKEKFREARKLWFASMAQKLREMHTKEDDSLFYYYSVEVVNPRIIAAPSLEGL